MGSPYILDNARKEAADRFPALSASFDPGTIRHLEDLGVGPGWQCLEVGGGGGSIAAWLAARVAPTGHVLATDIDTRFLESLSLANTEVRCHDIAADQLPEAAFDLVHARLVLLHVTEREQALRRMIAALKPGGWLIDEEFDLSVFPDPAKYPGEVMTKTFTAMVRIMNDRGVDQTFGRRLFLLLRNSGLADVAAEGRTIMWTAGSAGPALLRSNFEQLRTAMIDGGYVTQQEFEEDIARLDDPDFVMPSPVMWAAWCRRPQHPSH